MKLTFLGTGTSVGVPQIGCHCRVCTSSDPRDKRLRCSALVEQGDTNLLIDCGPDFREQMLRIGFEKPLDAVLITHEHYDHVGGIDDLRPFSYLHNLPLYADEYAITHLRQRLPYCLVVNRYPGVPQLTAEVVEPHETIHVGTLDVVPLRVIHGKLPILGFRIGPLGYITDMTTMPDEDFELLKGIKLLVVNALRHEPHPTHQTVAQAIEFSQRLGADLPTYLIHMSHHLGLHAEEEARLPENIRLAYDGLELHIEE
ncbi:MAG: MBL fold metallo-hydrolase [Bacteroidaceae bacterium]|nr:MBL fold metallo-hydrolase [Bacteroidaceae bacterium]